MTNRKRPSRHYRNIKTKKGRKRVLINPKIKKHKSVKHGTVKKEERRIFRFISNPEIYNDDKEFGGALDFQKNGKLERFTVTPGTKYSVDLPDDYEAQYHTHPTPRVDPPSPSDVIALIYNKKQQAEIVFRNGRAFIILKTPSTRALSKLPATQLQQRLDRAFLSSRGKNWEQKYKEALEYMGFVVHIDNNPNKALTVKIVPKEPPRKRRSKR